MKGERVVLECSPAVEVEAAGQFVPSGGRHRGFGSPSHTCTARGYFQKCPWDCVLPNKIQSQVGKLSRNRTLPLLWPE